MLKTKTRTKTRSSWISQNDDSRAKTRYRCRPSLSPQEFPQDTPSGTRASVYGQLLPYGYYFAWLRKWLRKPAKIHTSCQQALCTYFYEILAVCEALTPICSGVRSNSGFKKVLSGSSVGKSYWHGLYFTVYASSRHNTVQSDITRSMFNSVHGFKTAQSITCTALSPILWIIWDSSMDPSRSLLFPSTWRKESPCALQVTNENWYWIKESKSKVRWCDGTLEQWGIGESKYRCNETRCRNSEVVTWTLKIISGNAWHVEVGDHYLKISSP